MFRDLEGNSPTSPPDIIPGSDYIFDLHTIMHDHHTNQASFCRALDASDPFDWNPLV